MAAYIRASKAQKATAIKADESLELANMSPDKFSNTRKEKEAREEKREEILDRIIDIVISIKKLNIPLQVDYPAITNNLIHDFNKITVFNLIETMKRDSHLQANAPLYTIIQDYSNDIIAHLDLIYV
jgi:translation initiation factor 2 alpha subunit (eIF-2alpha)